MRGVLRSRLHFWRGGIVSRELNFNVSMGALVSFFTLYLASVSPRGFSRLQSHVCARNTGER